MSKCCVPTVPAERPAGSDRCPACERKGRQVEAITLKAMLRPDALARLEQAAYRFCPNPSCPVVYFADAEESLYHKEDLKVRVGLKETDDPVPICYCFGHTRASAWEEIRRTGESGLVQSISEYVQTGWCGCEVNNPSGACCLGEVSKTVKEGLARFGAQAIEPAGGVR